MKARMCISTFFIVLYIGLFAAHNGHGLLPSEHIHIKKLSDETPPTHNVKIKKNHRKDDTF